MKTNYLIFSDASWDPKSRTGVGAILLLESWDNLDIKTKVIESENIARLEIITALWAIAELKKKESGLSSLNTAITLYTDCQTLSKLVSRREKLEARGFRSKSSGKILNNADLYQKFFKIYDEIPFTITWVKGHSSKRTKDKFERVFSLVDKAAREKLRSSIKKLAF